MALYKCCIIIIITLFSVQVHVTHFAVAQSSCLDDTAMNALVVFQVLWMTLCFHIMGARECKPQTPYIGMCTQSHVGCGGQLHMRGEICYHSLLCIYIVNVILNWIQTQSINLDSLSLHINI